MDLKMSNSTSMIEYDGISDRLPKSSTTFKQFSKDVCLEIPNEKPEIYKIIKINTKVQIISHKIVKTPVGTSLEGQILTGNKLFVYGKIIQNVVYIANCYEQPVYSVCFETYFSEFIVLPSKFTLNTSIKIVPFVESVDVICFDNKHIDLFNSIFLDVRFCGGCKQVYKNICDIDCMDKYIKITGIAKKFPVNPKYFKEYILEETLNIPADKPEVEGLISISSEVEVVDMKLIKTNMGTSIEGQNLSGYKLIVELKQRDILVYTSQTVCQSVHSVIYESCVNSIFIVVPDSIEGIEIQDLIDNCNLKVTPYIEDIFVFRKSCRSIHRGITILLDVTSRFM